MGNDALYLALAEVLDAPLVTKDSTFTTVPGNSTAVMLVPATS